MELLGERTDETARGENWTGGTSEWLLGTHENSVGKQNTM